MDGGAERPNSGPDGSSASDAGAWRDAQIVHIAKTDMFPDAIAFDLEIVKAEEGCLTWPLEFGPQGLVRLSLRKFSLQLRPEESSVSRTCQVIVRFPSAVPTVVFSSPDDYGGYADLEPGVQLRLKGFVGYPRNSRRLFLGDSARSGEIALDGPKHEATCATQGASELASR